MQCRVRVAGRSERRPGIRSGEAAQRGHLGGRVSPAEIAGEAADRGDAPRAHGRHHFTLPLFHPGQRGGDGHTGLPALFQKGDKVRQQPGRLGHLVPEGPAKPQVAL